MAKKFGRNQKRKLREQLEQQMIEAKKVLDDTVMELDTSHRCEVDNLRGQVRALDTRRQHQVVINLAIDRDHISDERSLYASMHSTDCRHETISTTMFYDPRSIRYVVGYGEEQKAVIELAEMAARMISEDLFGQMRNQWGIGYGRDPKPLSRREQMERYHRGEGPYPY